MSQKLKVTQFRLYSYFTKENGEKIKNTRKDSVTFFRIWDEKRKAGNQIIWDSEAKHETVSHEKEKSLKKDEKNDYVELYFELPNETQVINCNTPELLSEFEKALGES
jgi:hypothetical protein